jgi:membrane-bound lytic murein transglycosylase
VNEVAARTVRAKPDAVVGSAKVGLVLGVAIDITNLMIAMGELALIAILADAMLLEGPAHLCLVPADTGGLRTRGGHGGTGGGRGLALASVELWSG